MTANTTDRKLNSNWYHSWSFSPRCYSDSVEMQLHKLLHLIILKKWMKIKKHRREEVSYECKHIMCHLVSDYRILPIVLYKQWMFAFKQIIFILRDAICLVIVYVYYWFYWLLLIHNPAWHLAIIRYFSMVIGHSNHLGHRRETSSQVNEQRPSVSCNVSLEQPEKTIEQTGRET